MTLARRVAAALLAVFFSSALLLGLRVSQYVRAPIPADAARVVIPKGAGLRDVARILRESGAAPWERGTAWGFRLWGRPRTVKAGLYAFKKGTRLLDVFADLEAGRVALVDVTLPEGLTAREMAKVLEAAGVVRAADFLALALDPTAAARWGLPGESLEGFLFPDTYRHPQEASAKSVVDAMLRRFRQQIGALEPLAKERGLSVLEWVTQASIVEKETGVEAEKPLVAAVFQNRLRMGMRLQSDPTVIYGIPEFDGNLRRQDLLRDTPYNTYTRAGLPKGPIANPGRSSLEAVLRPAPVPYLYFVSRNDGSHVFSQSYEEHRKRVKLYQRGGGP